MLGLSKKRWRTSTRLTKEQEEIQKLVADRRGAINKLKELDAELQQICKNGGEH